MDVRFRNNYQNATIILAISCILSFSLLFSCCSGNKTSSSKTKRKSTSETHKLFKVIKPKAGIVLHLGDSFSIKLDSLTSIIPDSVQLTINKKNIQLSEIDKLNYLAELGTRTVGNQNYLLKVFYSDSLTETHLLKLFVLSNIVPVNYNYKVVREFKHDPSAYTQGLLYHDGFIYESTGRKKHSSIRRINSETGEIVQKKALEPQFFGEGIALVGKEIYMITYISQVGFVYDAVTFDLIRKFNLQTKEGWGLTTLGNELILSDGTPNLYYIDPEYFSLNKQIEVCDDKGLITKINELEITPYGLFANVYGEDYIILIDVETGIVKGRVNLSELFPKDLPRNFDHVLNGIAFNPDNNTFYVTGKQWPVIYEIAISID